MAENSGYSLFINVFFNSFKKIGYSLICRQSLFTIRYTTWRYVILKDIHKLGLRGRLPTFIKNFYADRAMQVRVGSSLSDYYDQEQGVPQGGVLSTTFFSIKLMIL